MEKDWSRTLLSDVNTDVWKKQIIKPKHWQKSQCLDVISFLFFSKKCGMNKTGSQTRACMPDCDGLKFRNKQTKKYDLVVKLHLWPIVSLQVSYVHHYISFVNVQRWSRVACPCCSDAHSQGACRVYHTPYLCCQSFLSSIKPDLSYLTIW